jgi:hypothetical protein
MVFSSRPSSTCRIRPGAGSFRSACFFHLQLDVGVDLVVVEDAAGLQELAVASRLSRASRSEPQTVGMSFSFFRRQVVEVLVHGLARMDLVLDAVEPAISMAAKARYGLAIGSGKRTSTRLAFGEVAERNTARRRTVARRVGQQNRCFVTRNQTLVGVGRRVGEGVEALACLMMPPM